MVMFKALRWTASVDSKYDLIAVLCLSVQLLSDLFKNRSTESIVQKHCAIKCYLQFLQFH